MSEVQQLQPAPASAAAPKQEPSEYSVEFLIETAEGFHVLLRGEHLTPKDAMVWTRQASKSLHEQGFKPVRRDVAIELPAPAAAPPGKEGGRRQAGGNYSGEVYTACPWCGADVYDNRPKKSQGNWRGPWFKCKDDCGFVVFKANGEPNS